MQEDILLCCTPADLLLNLSRPFAQNPDNVSALIHLRGERGCDGSIIPVGNWRDSNNGLGGGEGGAGAARC